MYIVSGVTSSGKTTFLESELGRELGLDHKQVVHATDLTSDSEHKLPREDSILHYNLMRPAEFTINTKMKYYDFHQDPGFSFIEEQASDLSAIIILAKKDTVRNRMKRREESSPGKSYPSDRWLKIIDRYNLNEVYERFILEMERLGIPCRFYLSSDNPEEPFREVHRYSVKDILARGELYPLGNIRGDLRREFEYQKINLTHGMSTSGQNRAASFLDALALDLHEKTVLDVGSAMGGLAFSAEQMGASRVVGLEPKIHRFRASVEIKRVINSSCEFYNETVASFGSQENFDHIFLLSVIHHMPDFIHDLRTLSRMANDTLTIEFPGLTDPKYQKTFTGELRDNDLPLIGVSLTAKDQTFVFSPEGLKRIMMDHLNVFYSYETWESPMKNRFFMRFYK